VREPRKPTFPKGDIAIVEFVVLALLWLNEVRPVDDGVAPVEDRPLSLPRIGARR
jgi:hypothetical protein